MDRLDILNHLVKKFGYERYCEIGVFTGYTLDGCRASYKVGVDPNCEHYKGKENLLCMTSDQFFRTLSSDEKFQLFFIDGLHEAPQVYRDIENSLKHLSPGGTIVLHDCNPPKYEHTTTGIDGCWTGDTYKAFVRFRMLNPEYYTYTVDTDWGCGIIETPPYPGNYAGIDLKYVEGQTEWENFNRRREDLLNLISIEEFKVKLNERTANNYSTAK